ncbi:protocatechuate 3,4-dioxygenase subunit alpha [Microbacterium pseudoresistens]|uniref:Protocatechuate 3,4-dioxygenase alpha subunit n=1 Tax=Microbacterium pseudoresistens TaxID=640634 RepID=A0A7Y9EW37_9MICO|nr:protocatechuate 3,4-dioxygenase subunit alpha [Microbacterium pseudoresistens]NYD54896.1 protocatechuate 3,4-dioxygenase alpha subunit [Microbacterium pseudoresistens]
MAEVPERTHGTTGSQTIGPFFAFGLEYPRMHEVVPPQSPGSIVLGGTVYDGAGDPVPDSMIEIWSTDSDGSVPRLRGFLARDGRSFTGFGRAFTNDEGRYEFWTRNPGAPGDGAPFFAAVIFSRGLPSKLHTRIYLPGNDALLEADPLLSRLTAPERDTLVATRAPDGHLQHDIRLQGQKETVFLAFSN